MRYWKGEKLCFCRFAEVLSPQIINTQSVTFAEGPQICGFAICGNYLRATQLY
jgi:hypothetical protein